MWRAELVAHMVITGGGDEEGDQDILNELIALEIELNKGAREHFRVQERPIDVRVRFDLRHTKDRIKVFHNPKFAARPVNIVCAMEEEEDVNLD